MPNAKSSSPSGRRPGSGGPLPARLRFGSSSSKWASSWTTRRTALVGSDCPHPDPPPQAGEGVRGASSSRRGRKLEVPRPPDIIYGRNPVLEAFRAGRPVKRLLLAEGLREEPRLKELRELASDRRITIESADRRRLDDIAHSEAHQGVVAYVGPRKYWELEPMARGAPAEGPEAGGSARRAPRGGAANARQPAGPADPRHHQPDGRGDRRGRHRDLPQPVPGGYAVGRESVSRRRGAPALCACREPGAGDRDAEKSRLLDRGPKQRRAHALHRVRLPSPAGGRDRRRRRGAARATAQESRRARSLADARQGQLAQRRGRRLDPALRGRSPTRPVSRLLVGQSAQAQAAASTAIPTRSAAPRN